MKISKAERSSLIIALSELLDGAVVTGYSYVLCGNENLASFKDGLEEPIRKKLYGHLDDGGMESLLQKLVLSKIFETNAELPKSDGLNFGERPLRDYLGFENSLETAKWVCGFLEDAPYQYEAYYKVPASFSELTKGIDEVVVSDRLKLVSGQKLQEYVVLGHPNARIDMLCLGYNAKDPTARKIDPESFYFAYRTSGVLTDRSKPRCLIDFHDDIRAFFGLCIAHNLLVRGLPMPGTNPVLILANNIDGDQRKFAHLELADDDLQLADHLWLDFEARKGIQDGMSLPEILAPVIGAFRANEPQRLKTSAIWLFRANMTDRGMDRVLDATIALEVLLGDRETADRVGLSKLMANRCAYSLASSNQERSQISAFFMEFYRFRSEIVHSGRLKVSKSEAKLVFKGVKLASRMIRHEVKMGLHASRDEI